MKNITGSVSHPSSILINFKTCYDSQEGYLSKLTYDMGTTGGMCPWGECLGGTCPGGFCPVFGLLHNVEASQGIGLMGTSFSPDSSDYFLFCGHYALIQFKLANYLKHVHRYLGQI